jgi:hypothetical protein
MSEPTIGKLKLKKSISTNTLLNNNILTLSLSHSEKFTQTDTFNCNFRVSVAQRIEEFETGSVSKSESKTNSAESLEHKLGSYKVDVDGFAYYLPPIKVENFILDKEAGSFVVAIKPTDCTRINVKTYMATIGKNWPSLDDEPYGPPIGSVISDAFGVNYLVKDDGFAYHLPKDVDLNVELLPLRKVMTEMAMAKKIDEEAAQSAVESFEVDVQVNDEITAFPSIEDDLSAISYDVAEGVLRLSNEKVIKSKNYPRINMEVYMAAIGNNWPNPGDKVYMPPVGSVISDAFGIDYLVKDDGFAYYLPTDVDLNAMLLPLRVVMAAETATAYKSTKEATEDPILTQMATQDEIIDASIESLQVDGKMKLNLTKKNLKGYVKSVSGSIGKSLRKRKDFSPIDIEMYMSVTGKSFPDSQAPSRPKVGSVIEDAFGVKFLVREDGFAYHLPNNSHDENEFSVAIENIGNWIADVLSKDVARQSSESEIKARDYTRIDMKHYMEAIGKQGVSVDLLVGSVITDAFGVDYLVKDDGYAYYLPNATRLMPIELFALENKNIVVHDLIQESGSDDISKKLFCDDDLTKEEVVDSVTAAFSRTQTIGEAHEVKRNNFAKSISRSFANLIMLWKPKEGSVQNPKEKKPRIDLESFTAVSSRPVTVETTPTTHLVVIDPFGVKYVVKDDDFANFLPKHVKQNKIHSQLKETFDLTMEDLNSRESKAGKFSKQIKETEFDPKGKKHIDQAYQNLLNSNNGQTKFMSRKNKLKDFRKIDMKMYMIAIGRNWPNVDGLPFVPPVGSTINDAFGVEYEVRGDGFAYYIPTKLDQIRKKLSKERVIYDLDVPMIKITSDDGIVCDFNDNVKPAVLITTENGSIKGCDSDVEVPIIMITSDNGIISNPVL